MEKMCTLIFLCLFGSAFAQITSPGPCPKIEPMKNFDLKKMHGNWDEFARYTVPDESLEKCAKIRYMPGPNDTTIQVETSTCAMTGIKTSVPTYVSIDKATKLGNVSAHLMGRPEDVSFLIFTDYKCYYMAYDCFTEIEQNDNQNQNNQQAKVANGNNNNNNGNNTIHTKFAWHYVRHPLPAECKSKNIDKLIEKLNLDKAKFTLIRQKDCQEVKPPQ